MKKRLLLSMLLLTGVLCLTGCEEAQSKEVSASGQEDSKEPQEKDEDEQDDADGRDDQGDQDESGQDGDARDGEDGQESGQPEEDDSQEQYSPDITVYFSNEDATALDSEEIQMGSFSSENILNALVDKGVVTADVNSAASDGDSDVVFICERGCAADVRFVVGVVDGSYFRRTE